jgi:hypothetical protein
MSNNPMKQRSALYVGCQVNIRSGLYVVNPTNWFIWGRCNKLSQICASCKKQLFLYFMQQLPQRLVFGANFSWLSVENVPWSLLDHAFASSTNSLPLGMPVSIVCSSSLHGHDFLLPTNRVESSRFFFFEREWKVPDRFTFGRQGSCDVNQRQRDKLGANQACPERDRSEAAGGAHFRGASPGTVGRGALDTGGKLPVQPVSNQL